MTFTAIDTLVNKPPQVKKYARMTHGNDFGEAVPPINQIITIRIAKKGGGYCKSQISY